MINVICLSFKGSSNAFNLVTAFKSAVFFSALLMNMPLITYSHLAPFNRSVSCPSVTVNNAASGNVFSDDSF